MQTWFCLSRTNINRLIPANINEFTVSEIYNFEMYHAFTYPCAMVAYATSTRAYIVVSASLYLKTKG